MVRIATLFIAFFTCIVFADYSAWGQSPRLYSSSVNFEKASTHTVIEAKDSYYVLSSEQYSNNNVLRKLDAELNLLYTTKRFSGNFLNAFSFRSRIILIELISDKKSLILNLHPYSDKYAEFKSEGIINVFTIPVENSEAAASQVEDFKFSINAEGVAIAILVGGQKVHYAVINKNLEVQSVNGKSIVNESADEAYIDFVLNSDQLFLLKAKLIRPLFDNIPLISSFQVQVLDLSSGQEMSRCEVAQLSTAVRLRLAVLDGKTFVYGAMMDSLSNRVSSFSCFHKLIGDTEFDRTDFPLSNKLQLLLIGDKINPRNRFARAINIQVNEVIQRENKHLVFGLEVASNYEEFSYKKNYSDKSLRDDAVKYQISSKDIRDFQARSYSGLKRTFGRGAALLLETDVDCNKYWMAGIHKDQQSRIYQRLSYQLMEGDGELSIFYNDTRRQDGGFEYNSLRHCRVGNSGKIKCGPAEIIPALSSSDGIYLCQQDAAIKGKLLIPLVKEGIFQFAIFE